MKSVLDRNPTVGQIRTDERGIRAIRLLYLSPITGIWRYEYDGRGGIDYNHGEGVVESFPFVVVEDEFGCVPCYKCKKDIRRGPNGDWQHVSRGEYHSAAPW